MMNQTIDYSNTIFYKIYCKDENVTDKYIGHTTNFVQRQKQHKRSCINPTSDNHNCKVYKFIRDNYGWDNWKMEIIAFHACENLMSAKKYEQQYFEEYKATLNSIEPSPNHTIKKEKEIDAYVREVKEDIREEFVKNKLYECICCNYNTIRQNDYTKHLRTKKHINQISPQKIYICICGKDYTNNSGLWKHKKKCEYKKPIIDDELFFDKKLVIKILNQNNEFKELLVEQNNTIKELIEQN